MNSRRSPSRYVAIWYLLRVKHANDVCASFTEDDDGEDGEADDFEVTESDREKDRGLAIQFVTAALTGAATLAGVVPGALATMFAPIAAAIMTAAVQRLGRRRAEHAADTLLDAADAAGVPLGEFMDKAVADDRRHELFARTMRIAQDTARRDKRRALGRALAAGVMGDDARINEELLFIRAVDDLDEMHIRVLGRLVDGKRLTAGDIASADPGLGAGVPALLNQLQSHGLIDSRSPVTPGGAMTRNRSTSSPTWAGDSSTACVTILTEVIRSTACRATPPCGRRPRHRGGHRAVHVLMLAWWPTRIRSM